MYRSRFNKSRTNARRWQIAGVAGVAVTIVGVGLGVASAAETVPTVNCPQVTVPAVPAQAQAEVQRNLELLNTQIGEANNRLRTSAGQGGPNFVQNAILGPLKDKRFATINRIETAIGRNAAKPDLNAEGLSTCSLDEDGGAAAEQPTEVPGAGAGGDNGGNGGEPGVPTVDCPPLTGLPVVPAQAQAEVQRNLELLNTQIAEANNRLRTSVGQGGANFVQNAILGPLADKRFATINRIETAIGRNAAKPDLDAEGLSTCTLDEDGGAAAEQPTDVPGAGAGGDNPGAGAGGDNAGGGAAVPTVDCPALTGLPAVPAQAQAEVQRNLALLDTQVAEADARIVATVGQGGPDFVRNAILGPLADKRFATINRIETAIGRNAVKPNLNAEGLAPCSLNG